MANIVKFIWIGASFFVLYVTLDAFASTHDARVMDVLDWLMLILSFPAGLVVAAAHYTLSFAWSITIETSYLSLALKWFLHFIFGYTQWFVLLPWLWRKWRERCSESPHG